MTDFNFTSQDTDVSALESMDDDTKSVAEFIDGTVTVDLCDEAHEYLVQKGKERKNTGTGMPKSKRGYSPDKADAADESGICGEGGLHIAYDEWTFDKEIIQNGGDGGIDGTIEIDGTEYSADVKTPTSQYNDDPWLKVLMDKDEYAEVYILASYSDQQVTYHGWIHRDDLITEANKADGNILPQDNYALTDYDACGGSLDLLNEMPPLSVASRSLVGDAHRHL